MTPTPNATAAAPADTAILVCTCRSFEYMLGPFLSLWRRYWPDCRLPLHVASDGDLSALPGAYGVHVSEYADDPGFVNSWLRSLEDLDCVNVLVLQEDFLIERPVDNALIEQYCRTMSAHEEIACIRVLPSPRPRGRSHRFAGVELAEFRKGDAYVFSWQATLWNRETLIAYFRQRLERGERVLAELRDGKRRSYRDLIPKRGRSGFPYIDPELHGDELFELFPDKLFLGHVPPDGDYETTLREAPLFYRPTAVGKGELRLWAQDLLVREGLEVAAPKLERRSVRFARRAKYHTWGRVKRAVRPTLKRWLRW